MASNLDRIVRGTAARLSRRLHDAGARAGRLAERPHEGAGAGVATPAPATPPPLPSRRPVLPYATTRRHEDIEWFHSIDLGDGTVTAGVKSPADLEGEFAVLGLGHEQLEGRTVLDVGTADGWNALACERLGATVTAVDGVYRDGLRYVRSRLAPRFRFVQLDVHGSSFLELGTFDVVLYLGVLYHTPYPFEQLVRVAARCRDLLLLESAYLNLPGAEREPTLTYNFDGHVTADLSSPVFPSVAWIEQALAQIGFRRVEILRGGEARMGRVIVRAQDLDPHRSPTLFAAEQVHV